jgi:hypothetical protein
MCTDKRELYSRLTKYWDFGVYSMNKTGGRRKMFITRANKTVNLVSAHHLLKTLLLG